jgi:hypothetical protein
MVVRSVAKRKLRDRMLSGQADLAARLRTRGTDALARAPREVRDGISDGIDQGLRQSGLSRTELRQYVAAARQLQDLLRRFS